MTLIDKITIMAIEKEIKEQGGSRERLLENNIMSPLKKKKLIHILGNKVDIMVQNYQTILRDSHQRFKDLNLTLYQLKMQQEWVRLLQENQLI